MDAALGFCSATYLMTIAPHPNPNRNRNNTLPATLSMVQIVAPALSLRMNL